MEIKVERGGLGRCNIIIMNVWEDNDYQQTHLRKVLILECLDLNRSEQFMVDIHYDSEARQLDLGPALTPLLDQILLSQHDHQLFYFHPRNHHYVYAGLYPLRAPLTIGEDFISTSHISIRVRRLGSEVETLEQGKEARDKPRRVPQRTVRQVLQKVSQWRQINQKNPKITLEDAARMVGVPKKTLDDYYKQIKAASQHHFDFQKNLGEKIGFLRRFVREKHLKKKEQHFQFLPALLRRPSEEEEEGEGEEQEE